MEPQVITPTKQQLAGISFYPNDEGYFKSDGHNGGLYLARVRYSMEYGNIPRGWHVHHRDGDKSNNTLRNLVAQAPWDHYREHSTKWTVAKTRLTCQQCEQPFDAVWKNAKYCCTSCRVRAYKLRNKAK